MKKLSMLMLASLCIGGFAKGAADDGKMLVLAQDEVVMGAADDDGVAMRAADDGKELPLTQDGIVMLSWTDDGFEGIKDTPVHIARLRETMTYLGGFKLHLSLASLLSFLDISGQNIERIENGAFADAKLLTHLDISNNPLTDLTSSQMAGLQALDTLKFTMPVTCQTRWVKGERHRIHPLISKTGKSRRHMVEEEINGCSELNYMEGIIWLIKAGNLPCLHIGAEDVAKNENALGQVLCAMKYLQKDESCTKRGQLHKYCVYIKPPAALTE